MAQKVQLRELPNSQLVLRCKENNDDIHFKIAYKYALINHHQECSTASISSAC